MRPIFATILVAILQLVLCDAVAGTVTVTVTGDDGKTVTNAVVELIATRETPLPESVPALPASANIDQSNLTFLPLVTILKRGGQIVFANNDNTRHQVYSFSTVKQFEFEIDQGRKSPPVQFDQTGVAAVGCNIHDNMVSFVYVTENRLTMLTRASGEARFVAVPNGNYRVEIWHPRLPPRAARPQLAINVTDAPLTAPISVSLMSGAMSGMSDMSATHNKHKQSY